MYKIEKTTYGIRLTFSGFMNVEEMRKWKDESIQFLKTVPGKFLIVVDMKDLKTLPPDARDVLIEGQAFYRQDDNPNAGIERSAVLLSEPLTRMQMLRVSKETGLHRKEKYFLVSEPDWEAKMNAWLHKGVDPDQ